MNTAKTGSFISQLRKEKGLTQDQIAEVLGASPQTISRWETGTSCPDITMLPAIASYFDITTDELLGIKKPVKKQKILYKLLKEKFI